MSWQPAGWSRAILHIDGDAFFASCEQAVHPEYRGRPVITGKERGIVAAASYEAKARGVARGVALRDVRRLIPDAIIVPSDYETYSLFSERMFAIMRRFTSMVETYGIDEGFVDITGLQRPLNMSYITIAQRIQEAIHTELGIGVSVGLGPTKALAKFGSRHRKPRGFTAVAPGERQQLLAGTALNDIWGIGSRTAAYCRGFGLLNALDFAAQTEAVVHQRFTKPTIELWHELNGRSVWPINPAPKTSYASIGKTRTFTPASAEAAFVFAQLLKNVENACIKARRHGLAGNKLVIFLKQQNFSTSASEATLSRASAYPQDLVRIVQALFQEIYRRGTTYRATGVVLMNLVPDDGLQRSLFEPPVTLERTARVYAAVDALAEKYGKHTVHLLGSQVAHATAQHGQTRDAIPARAKQRLPGESKRKHLRMPVLNYQI